MANKYQYREARTPASKGKRLHHLEVRQAENGGHVVTHHFHEDGLVYHKPVDHVFGEDEGDEALSHIAKHAKINVSGRGEGEDIEEDYE